MEFRVKNPEEWAAVAQNILPELRENILLLKGNLGAGKTTFTQYLLKEMGSRDTVSSPTYSIVNEYDTNFGKVFHFDLYRLKNIQEVYETGIEEYLDNGRLCIIEWPEIFDEELRRLPHHQLLIDNDGDGRYVKFY